MVSFNGCSLPIPGHLDVALVAQPSCKGGGSCCSLFYKSSSCGILTTLGAPWAPHAFHAGTGLVRFKACALGALIHPALR